MEIVTISPKYQIVIPAKVRRSLELYPGQKIQVILYNNRIELIPVKPIQTALGFLPEIDTTIEREPDRL
jgi:AbrB family looped-hinge helix DNA binding protein